MASRTNVSDEDVAAVQSEVEKLRAELAATEAQRLERERNTGNAIQLAQLNAEKENLKLQLQRAKASATASAVNDGVSAPLDAARASMEAAIAAQKEETKAQKADEKNAAAVAATTSGDGS